MALSTGSYTVDVAEPMKSFVDSSGRNIPAISVTDDNGDQIGITGNPLLVQSSPSDAAITPAHTFPNVTTSDTEMIAANANRRYLMLINDSDVVIYLALGDAAVLNRGIRLNPAGGVYEMSPGIGNLFTGAVRAIHGGSGNKALLITEGI